MSSGGSAVSHRHAQVGCPAHTDDEYPFLCANDSSALYHTFKILLYRPMLSKHQDVSTDGRNLQPMQQYLMECVSSATSIISIFDLFSRSFGVGHCVLSLAYSVYIASSIFLLQIQSGTDDGNALHRLEYCVRTLAQVQRLSPGKRWIKQRPFTGMWLMLLGQLSRAP